MQGISGRGGASSTAVAATVHPEGVVVVTLQDRDARNMFTESLTSGLKEVFALVDRSPEHKVVVLTGYDSYFATGGTRETLQDLAADTAYILTEGQGVTGTQPRARETAPDRQAHHGDTDKSARKLIRRS